MNKSVDMVKLVLNLPCRARGRACIVLTHEHEGQKEWAAELARRTDSQHLDLLALFAKDTDLGGNIARFSVSALFDFLQTANKHPQFSSCGIHHSESDCSPVLIVSGIEFLKAAWSGQANSIEQFASNMETWNRKPCLLIVLQYDKIIATREFRRYRQHTFVIDQKETLAL